MKALLRIIVLFVPVLLSAQKHDYVWMQGNYNNFYIDFSDLDPNIYPVDSDYEFSRSLVFTCDSFGNPAFYSNGCNIKNKQHQLIDKGEELHLLDYYCDIFGYLNITHGILTLPGYNYGNYFMLEIGKKPESSEPPCETNILVAHTIDMSANQGTGRVIEKEQLLLSGCFQEPTANKHANGRDWWILLPDNQQSRFYRWLLTPSGLEGPWVQEITNETIDGYWYCGWSEFSPNGERYLINGCRKGVEVYNFDRCTGLLSNPILVERSPSWNFGAAFSPNSQYVYTTDTSAKVLLQYDLNTPDITQSKTILGVWDGKVDSSFIPAVFGFMQHGPNGKLYVWGGGSSIMHVIDFPDRKGLDCGLRQYAIQLPASCFSANLYYPHYRLGPIDGASCDTLGIDNHPVALFRYDLEDTLSPLQVTFTDVSSYAPTTWHWTFGDGATSNEVNPEHTYTQGGDYEVCLIVSNAFAADTFCRQVQVGVTNVHTLPALPHARVWPNPFSTELHIQLPAMVGVSPEFVLYDLYGRIVKTARLTDFDNRIPVPELPSGMYVWQLRWKGAVTQVGRVLKQ